MDVSVMPYQDRQVGVKDKHGNIWWLSQRLVEGPYLWLATILESQCAVHELV
jgi:hypothetical protein